jgi:hypothetical protein
MFSWSNVHCEVYNSIVIVNWDLFLCRFSRNLILMICNNALNWVLVNEKKVLMMMRMGLIVLLQFWSLFHSILTISLELMCEKLYNIGNLPPFRLSVTIIKSPYKRTSYDMAFKLKMLQLSIIGIVFLANCAAN